MDGWAIALDHIPIDIRLSRACHPRPPSRRYAIRKLDRAGLEERIKLSGWETDQDPLSKIKIVVKEALDQCCPRAKPHEKANHRWSPRAAELLVGARRARRAYLSTLQAHHYQAMRSFQNLLKKELRRGGRSAWRRFIQEITTSKQLPHNKGLWRMSRWSKQTPGTSAALLPPLRRNDQEQVTLSNEGRAQILAEKFFPRASLADLSDIASGQPAANTLDVPAEVTPKQLEEVIRKLPNGRAPGPDGIPNEILKVIAPIVSKDLAHAISKQLESGMISNLYKESTIVMLCKERKKDYSLSSSYRSVTLEDMLAKVIEKIITTRIEETAEKHTLLS